MSTLFAYPPAATYDRIVPKQALYQHGRMNHGLRAAFAAEVESIRWRYKLAPETINLPPRGGINEIQIFSIELKHEQLSETVLRAIDQAANFPLFYELEFEQQVQPVAAYRRIGDSGGKPVVGRYFHGDWLPADSPRQTLPPALDLAGLYRQLLRSLIPLPVRPNEDLHDQMQRLEQIETLQTQRQRTEARLRRERQFNRKVSINAELRQLNNELRVLSRADDQVGHNAPSQGR